VLPDGQADGFDLAAEGEGVPDGVFGNVVGPGGERGREGEREGGREGGREGELVFMNLIGR